MKMHITLEPRGLFRSNFAYLYVHLNIVWPLVYETAKRLCQKKKKEKKEKRNAIPASPKMNYGAAVTDTERSSIYLLILLAVSV